MRERKFLQEGFARLWRGTYASLTLAVPTVSFARPDICPEIHFELRSLLSVVTLLMILCFLPRAYQVGIYMPCYDIFRNFMEDFTTENAPGLTPYVPLVAGSIARSLACISCYPVELARTRMQVLVSAHRFFLILGLYVTICYKPTSYLELVIHFFASLSKAFIDNQTATKPPGVWKTLVEVINPVRSSRLQDRKYFYNTACL